MGVVDLDVRARHGIDAKPVAETIAAAGGNEFWLDRPGGIRLRAAVFGEPGARGWCVFLPGYTEFIEKNLETMAELRARGFAVATLDWRGQGLSSRLLADRHRGHVLRMEDHRDDALAVLEHVGALGRRPLVVIGHSMGGHLALRVLMHRPEIAAAAVLIAPMLGISRAGLPNAAVRALVEALCTLGWQDSYVFGGRGYGPRRRRFEGNPLTHDAERFERMHRLIDAQPDLVITDPSFGWVRAAFRSINHVMAPGRLEAVRTPILIVKAGQETIVSNQAIDLAVRRLPNARLEPITSAKHEILRETDAVRGAFWRAVDGFLAEVAGA